MFVLNLLHWYLIDHFYSDWDKPCKCLRSCANFLAVRSMHTWLCINYSGVGLLSHHGLTAGPERETSHACAAQECHKFHEFSMSESDSSMSIASNSDLALDHIRDCCWLLLALGTTVVSTLNSYLWKAFPPKSLISFSKCFLDFPENPGIFHGKQRNFL